LVHAAQMVDAYMNQRPWIGYYWTPSTVFGSLDMVPIEDGVFPPLSIRKLVRSDLRRYPDLFSFIETYELTTDQMSELLAVRDETGWSYERTAQWFLDEKTEIWEQWFDSDAELKTAVMKAVQAAL